MSEHIVTFDSETEAALIDGGTTADKWIADNLDNPIKSLLQSYRSREKTTITSKYEKLEKIDKDAVDAILAKIDLTPKPETEPVEEDPIIKP